jgi:hypothetical protein
LDKQNHDRAILFLVQIFRANTTVSLQIFRASTTVSRRRRHADFFLQKHPHDMHLLKRARSASRSSTGVCVCSEKQSTARRALYASPPRRRRCLICCGCTFFVEKNNDALVANNIADIPIREDDTDSPVANETDICMLTVHLNFLASTFLVFQTKEFLV